MILHEIMQGFGISEEVSFSEIGGGHINTTYHVGTESGKEYILQSLNRKVFLAPEIVMDNIGKIEKAFADSGEHKVAVPHFLEAADGKNYIDCGGDVYRAYPYVAQADKPQDCNYKTGYSFGAFIRILSSSKLKLMNTIEDFHSFQTYFSALTAAGSNSSPLKKIDKSIMRRIASVNETLSQVFTVDFHRRYVHNDAKSGNVIIGENMNTVIDLDTVMNGYAAVDYGDMIRSVCTGAFLDIGAVMELTNGFADGLGGILTPDEVDSLYYGILYVTAELAVRYLTDYFNDDKYFKGKTSAECLGRANELLTQLNMFISCGDDITDIIYNAFGKQ